MGLSSALLSAVSGLQTTQAGVEVVSRNIANAETPGYTRKLIQQQTVLANGEALGVRATEVTRVLDSLMQGQLRTELGAQARADVVADTLARLDAMFGVPGGAGALDTAVNQFVAAFQALSDSPDSPSARAGVVAQTESLVFQINSLSLGIQGLRETAEQGISDAVSSANQILDSLGKLNGRIGTAAGDNADLLDQRDSLLAQLSHLLPIHVQETDSGSVRVFTSAGNLLVDGARSANLVFDARSQLSANALYSSDPAARDVGTVRLDNGSGQQIDLFNGGPLNDGLIGGYRALRDDILVGAQSQLDELAHALASALSDTRVDGNAVAVGAQNGFDVDLGALLPGDEISITYTRTPPGETRTVTVVGVEDASLLPLSDAATANPGDTVIGIDFSGGVAGAAAALDAALGASFSVSNPGGDTLRILDDGAAGTISIGEVAAHVTATGTADGGLGLALFTDGPGGAPYTNALEGQGQKTGFAGRISVNPAIKADDRALVIYSTSPPTSIGDQTRPQELLARLSETPFTFTAVAGLGSPGSPLTTTIDDYARQFVSHQTGRAATAEAARSAQSSVTSYLEQQVKQESGVDVDEELSKLVVLQNAYAANARVISVLQELFETLTRI